MLKIKTLWNSLVVITIIFISKFYYVVSATCQDNNCNSCSNYDFTNTCTECNIGYYVSSKSTCTSCPTNCKVCTDKCIECNPGYYLTNNDYCNMCPSSCEKCKLIPSSSSSSSESYCETCKSGYYLNSKTIIYNS